MANMLFANNANTTLASSLTNSATTMSVISASAFPAPTGSQYFYCTLADAATQTTIEIVKVTAVSGTTFTIVRGQDGTSGTAFSAGAVVSLRLVRASLNDFPKLDEANTFTQAQTFSTLTAGRIPYSTTGGLQTDSANLQFDGSNLTVSGVFRTGTASGSKILQLGLDSPNANNGGALRFNTSNSATNWQISSNFVVTASALEFTPSTTAGGSSWTTPSVSFFASGGVSIGNTTDPGATNLSVTGSILVNTTSALNGGRLSVLYDASVAQVVALRDSATTYANNNNYIYLTNSSGNSVGGITHPASQSIGLWGSTDVRFFYGSGATEGMRLDNAANLGIGVIPSTNAGQHSLQIAPFNGGFAAISLGASQAEYGSVGYNVGYTSTSNTYKYLGADSSSMIRFDNGSFKFFSAPSGTAGNTISFTQAMTLFASGGLSLGNTTDPGATNLSVSGTINTKGYTVATLPTGVTGATAYVTNALSPVFGSTVVGGGAITVPVFYNGSNWIVG